MKKKYSKPTVTVTNRHVGFQYNEWYAWRIFFV